MEYAKKWTICGADMPEEYSILCERLTKKFENVVAVDNLSLRVKKGELFGFI